jgi:transposase-like protein
MAHEIEVETWLSAFGYEASPATAVVVEQPPGACPRCGAAQEFQPGGRFADRRSFDCPKCHGNLTLAVPPAG